MGNIPSFSYIFKFDKQHIVFITITDTLLKSLDTSLGGRGLLTFVIVRLCSSYCRSRIQVQVGVGWGGRVASCPGPGGSK